MQFEIDNSKITILIADDEPTNRLIIKSALLKEKYNIIEATNGIEALNLAKEYIPDVILMDAMMPKMNGFEAIEKIQEDEKLQNIPILMITALDSKEDKIKAFNSGANDFLNKPIDFQELLLRVRSFVRIRYLYLQNIKARLDTNYNLPNLQALREDIQKAEHPIGIFFQIKNFENIIYLSGLEGSKIIVKKMIENIIAICKINKSQLYIISEDRFVIFFDNKKYSLKQLEKLSKKILSHINDRSFGIGILKSDIKINVVLNTIKENFIQIGIVSLKEAYKTNKNYLIADYIYEDLLKNVEKTMQITEYIDKAIKEDRIIPVFQPIYDNHSDKIYKCECLVRIKKEDGSLMSPFFFLDIAKQSEQYDKITKIMIQKTFEYMKDKKYQFSINLSSLDIDNKETIQFLYDKLEEYNFHDRVIIELLEDEAIDDFELALNFIKDVKKKGLKVAIDDYGSGYSNLERIFQFEPDYLKIDGSIIKDICNNETKFAIAKSSVFLAKEIGIETIGEFVASKEIFEKIKEIGVDFTQGYYISEPKQDL